jgi:hypothetical protein
VQRRATSMKLLRLKLRRLTFCWQISSFGVLLLKASNHLQQENLPHCSGFRLYDVGRYPAVNSVNYGEKIHLRFELSKCS